MLNANASSGASVAYALLLPSSRGSIDDSDDNSDGEVLSCYTDEPARFLSRASISILPFRLLAYLVKTLAIFAKSVAARCPSLITDVARLTATSSSVIVKICASGIATVLRLVECIW